MSKPSYMSAADVRSSFLQFFRAHSHIIVPSSSLVPANDPTLLFTNAGMVQFKDVFLGQGHSAITCARRPASAACAPAASTTTSRTSATRPATTRSSRCSAISPSATTSSGEAIRFAWDFLIFNLGLDPARLWCTVYKDDDEAADIWLRDSRREPAALCAPRRGFQLLGDGRHRPCGPCSEIFYDHGESIAGGPPGSADEEGDRYVEIWNLVFMQFDRGADGTLTPLPKPSVDTGMGLERIAAVMQGVHSNYDIDLFKNLIRAAGRLAGTSVLTSSSLRVIADHIRACTFLIVDGVSPSNEGRGYVLRRIIRRADPPRLQAWHPEPFFYKLVPVLERSRWATPTPSWSRGRAVTPSACSSQEEERFAETLANGMVLLESAIRNLRGAKVLDGDTVFKLYDTFGFPVDLTADVARERGLAIDQARFEAAMEEQRRRSQEASRFGVDLSAGAKFDATHAVSRLRGAGGERARARAAEAGRAGRSTAGRRRGRSGARSHPVLRRGRRPGGRCGRAARQ